MPSVSTVLAHWSYGAIFLTVVLGNVGLPVPEETVLVLAGYAVWRGDLHGPTVLAVGVVSAVVGDNLGYWLGRRYGRLALERYGPWVGVTADRLRRVADVVARYGGWAVLVARFVTGFRVLAGPLAGATGFPPRSFLLANILGACLFVPFAVGLGYGVGYGFGAAIERVVRGAEHAMLLGAAALTAVILAFRLTQARWHRTRNSVGKHSR